ncbi:Protein of unknown function [Gryllus bimaculatus]|nr:Protein of unknown function [Gryllus bimaculatus]
MAQQFSLAPLAGVCSFAGRTQRRGKLPVGAFSAVLWTDPGEGAIGLLGKEGSLNILLTSVLPNRKTLVSEQRDVGTGSDKIQDNENTWMHSSRRSESIPVKVTLRTLAVVDQGDYGVQNRRSGLNPERRKESLFQ